MKKLPDLTSKQLSRFLGSINIGEAVDCWNWAHRQPGRRYGKFKAYEKSYAAHRLAFKIFTGIDPCSFLVCHTCDNGFCCNPYHLFLGNTKDNAKDMVAKGRVSNGLKHSLATKEKTPRGSRSTASKLTEQAVYQILKEIQDGCNDLHSLAQKYNVHRQTIWSVAHRRTWIHVDPPLDYKIPKSKNARYGLVKKRYQ